LLLAKRPAKENIEKFLQAEYALHGSKLFAFIFGSKLAKAIEENTAFWFDSLASAFSGKCSQLKSILRCFFLYIIICLVSKNLIGFGEKLRLTPDDIAHFRKVIEIVHNGQLEEIPKFAQEAVNQGLASLIEKLYESGFMD